MHLVLGEHKDGVTGHITKGEVNLRGNPTLFLKVESAIQARDEAHKKLGEVGMDWNLEIVPMAEYAHTAK